MQFSLARLLPHAVLGAAALALTSCNFFLPYAPDQVCETLIRAQCHFAFDCCNASERNDFQADLAKYRTEDDCVQDQLLQGDAVCGLGDVVNASVAAGRFEYDGAAAQKCLQPQIDALNQCDAATILGGKPIVRDASCDNGTQGTGKVKAGDACFETYECADKGGACRKAPDPTDGTPAPVTSSGTCIPPVAPGADCSKDGLCTPGFSCQGNDNGTVSCRAVPTVTPQDNGASCSNDNECKSGFCNGGGFFGSGTCADRKLPAVEACLGPNAKK
jgi:hypothetical protein